MGSGSTSPHLVEGLHPLWRKLGIGVPPKGNRW